MWSCTAEGCRVRGFHIQPPGSELATTAIFRAELKLACPPTIQVSQDSNLEEHTSQNLYTHQIFLCTGACAAQVRDLSSFDISWIPVTNNRTEMVQLSKAHLSQDEKYNALSKCVLSSRILGLKS